jgi:tRNA threonylcarbamoyl adenosine modification protein (Sua5/YciO/YrdC/YwlC family)
MLLTFYPGSVNDRHVDAAVRCLKEDGVLILPTDTVYAMACSLHSAKAFERMCRLKGVRPDKAQFSLLCSDLSNISEYTRPISREVFRLMKSCLPGPFTFILQAGHRLPSVFRSSKKTIGIRVPDHVVPQAVIRAMELPLVVTSVRNDDEILDYATDPEVIDEKWGHQVDLILDGGTCDFEPSTIVDCTAETPVVVREGKGVLK